MTITATLIAATLMGTTVNALPADTVATPPAPVSVQAEEPAKTRAVRYCIKDTLTGTRVPRKVCKSREAWIAQGIPADKL